MITIVLGGVFVTAWMAWMVACAAADDAAAPSHPKATNSAISFYRDLYVADEISLEVYEIVVADLLKGES